MKKQLSKKIYIVIVIAAVLISGCAKKGFDKDAIAEDIYSAPVIPVITDDEIKRILDIQPQIQFPFRLGVHFSAAHSSSWHRWRDRKWDKDDQSIAWLEPLIDEEIAAEIVLISSAAMNQSADKQSFLRTVRLAAARHNVDAVMIIDYNAGVDRYNNFSAFLYLTIIGGYIIPGTHSDALVIMKGALWDVRNEYLYMTVETEGEARKLGPAFLLEDGDSVREAKQQALKELKQEILWRMKKLKR